MKWAEHVECMGEIRYEYKILVTATVQTWKWAWWKYLSFSLSHALGHAEDNYHTKLRAQYQLPCLYHINFIDIICP